MYDFIVTTTIKNSKIEKNNEKYYLGLPDKNIQATECIHLRVYTCANSEFLQGQQN